MVLKMKILFQNGSVSNDITDLDFALNQYTCGEARRGCGYKTICETDTLLVRTSAKKGSSYIWVNALTGIDRGVIKDSKFQLI